MAGDGVTEPHSVEAAAAETGPASSAGVTAVEELPPPDPAMDWTSPAVIGVGAGAGVLVLVAIALLVLFRRRRSLPDPRTTAAVTRGTVAGEVSDGVFSRLVGGLARTRGQLVQRIDDLFAGGALVDAELLGQLEEV
ncbi:MAG: hypothetical protein QGH45_24230, partial [Myxococcota bacterium]|nr:hypothetical protein [Myxococcota bacterium]